MAQRHLSEAGTRTGPPDDHRRLLLVSTCGTSTLTNPVRGTDAFDWLNRMSNRPSLDPAEAARLDGIRGEAAAKLAADARRASAELNGIAAELEATRPMRVIHCLVHSDTAVGRASAQLIEQRLNAGGETVLLLTAAGLRTDNLLSFRGAMDALTVELTELLQGYRTQGWEVAFNLTGGFKSVNGYLQALGSVLADRCYYLFESSPERVIIPRAPLALDVRGPLGRHLRIFRRLAAGLPVPSTEAGDIPDALLERVDDTLGLSYWGKALWAAHRAALLAEVAPTSIDPAVVLTAAFNRDAEAFDSRRPDIAAALDELAAHLAAGAPLLASRKFKPLQGNPVPGCTHELYAWSDGEAARIFGTLSGRTFTAASLRPHLK